MAAPNEVKGSIDRVYDSFDQAIKTQEGKLYGTTAADGTFKPGLIDDVAADAGNPSLMLQVTKEQYALNMAIGTCSSLMANINETGNKILQKM